MFCSPLAHTGHLVSGYVKQHLPIILVNHMTTEKNVQKTLTSGFLEVDKSLSNSRIDCEFSGSTAVVSYLKVCLLSCVQNQFVHGQHRRCCPVSCVVDAAPLYMHKVTHTRTHTYSHTHTHAPFRSGQDPHHCLGGRFQRCDGT